MLIAAFDVHYLQKGCASAAAVLFHDYRDAEPAREYTLCLSGVEDYVPGEFYRRELPCILALLARFQETPDEIVVDGYAMLGDRPGLGQHLYESLGCKFPVIGVAKSRFDESSGARIFRGASKRPLYVTAAGKDQAEASENIESMHGPHRVPTLLKRVDLLARKGSNCCVEKVFSAQSSGFRRKDAQS